MKLLHLSILFTATLICSSAAKDSVIDNQGGKKVDAEPWLSPGLKLRARYEFGNAQALDPSHALTLSLRPSIKLQKSGFSLFAEGHATLALVDDYNASADTQTRPHKPGNTQINDPRDTELNQLFVRYQRSGHQLTAGRQVLIFDNAAHIGNVGWRQNEQTFDAVYYSFKPNDDWKFQYVFANRVNRIFGNNAPYPLSHFDASIHLVNTHYKLSPDLDLGMYYYSADFKGTAQGLGNHTAGAHLTTKAEILGHVLTIRQENAWQWSRSGAANSYDAWYNHSSISTAPLDGHMLSAGFERLGDASTTGAGTSFRAPLSTAHAFNGYADAFVGSRIGGSASGLSDFYLSYTFPLAGKLKSVLTYHHFRDADLGTGLGNELDLVLKQALTNNCTAIAKTAYFQGSNSNDITRFSLELNYTF